MTLDEVIERFNNNAEYERSHGSLQACLEFRQFAEWLGELKKLKEQTEPCEDAISRQAAIEFLKKPLSASCMMEYLENAPSVQTEQKVGHWIEQEGYDGDVYYDCSACGNSWTTIDGTPWDNGMNYCPCCGAKMFEQKESEDKECRY